MGEDACLAGTCSGHYAHPSFSGLHGLVLLFVESHWVVFGLFGF